jgi:GNAT superfamily N-acetyltransferase
VLKSYVFSGNENQAKEPPNAPESVTASLGKCVGVVDDASQQPSLRHLIRITDVTSNLFKDALELYCCSFTASYELSGDDLTKLVEQGEYIMLVQSLDGKQVRALAIIGNLELYEQSYCLLDYFVVDPKFRGGGYGAKFYNVVVEYLREYTSYRVMLLECDNGLMTWYKKLGATRSDIPSSLCLENIDDDVQHLQSFNLMYMPIQRDDNKHEVDPERLRTVIVHIRSCLHDLFHLEERVYERDGIVATYFVWW